MMQIVFNFADGKRVTTGILDHCLQLKDACAELRESEFMDEQFLRAQVQEMYIEERAKGIPQSV